MLLTRILAFVLLGSATQAIAQTESDASKVSLTGAARVRSEWKNNADFNESAKDSTNSTGTKLFADIKYQANDRMLLHVQPQFSKIWGQAEYVPTGAAANTETTTSGGTRDSQIDLHQAYVHYLATPTVGVTIGRREISYGDQLLVGALGWSNVGRSFDMAAVDLKHNWGKAELFNAKVKDNNISAAAAGDKDFSGLYLSNNLGDWLNEMDVYAFLSADRSVVPQAKTHAYGLRAKSLIGLFDYRVEGTFEHVVNATTRSDEHQYDIEAGYKFFDDGMLRLSAEYFYASAGFDQLYPTGHKWLGYADLFSRRNITGYRVGAKAKLTGELTAALDYHQFLRAETDQPAYKYSGAAYGSTGDSAPIASEFDLVVGYAVDQNLDLELGAARTEPGDYLRDNSVPDLATFYYIQATTKF